MTNTLVFPLPHFMTMLRQLAEEPNRHALCMVGMCRLVSETRYLVRRVERAGIPLSPYDLEHTLTVSVAQETFPHDDFQFPPLAPSGALGQLIIGTVAQRGTIPQPEGHWQGRIKTRAGAFERVDGIWLVGAGMHQLEKAHPSGQIGEAEASAISMRQTYPRFSRTIVALGAGHWRRLTSLHVAVMGCGRSGSLAAVTLAKLGVRTLTLIDPDRLEVHNLAEMDGVTDADVGRPKVEALAAFLQTHCAPPDAPLNITAIPEPITTAHRVALAADVLFCCVDNDAARLACGILATLFHKVLIDIGTGIHFTITNDSIRNPHPPPPPSTGGDAIRNRMMGADVRLILPACGCLPCFGGVANSEEAIAELIRSNRPPDRSREPWWVRRVGSLRTLNLLAVSVGVQLLCDSPSG